MNHAYHAMVDLISKKERLFQYARFLRHANTLNAFAKYLFRKVYILVMFSNARRRIESMRCRLGEKKLRHYSRIYEMNFTFRWVRGNTEHRVDLWDGKEWYHHFPKDGLYKETEQNPFSGWVFMKNPNYNAPYILINPKPKKVSFVKKIIKALKGRLK